MIIFEKVVDNDNPETTGSLISNFTPVYHSISSNEILTSPTHLAKFNKLLTSVESLV